MNEINFWEQKFKIGETEQTFLDLYRQSIINQQIAIEVAKVLYKKGILGDDDIQLIENGVFKSIKNKMDVNLGGVDLKQMFEK